MTAPFAKVNATADGGREVWGFTTLERKDKAGEIADFDGTVKAFSAWSDEVSKRTNGENLGNVRLMHEKIPAGKTIHWEPTEKTITDESGNETVVKGIYVGAYIPPTKPEIIKDVDEKILTGFSIGGNYQKRWWDETSKAFRYIPTIAEYSLVDNPCVEGADIVSVIAKADGPWNKDFTNLEKGEDTLKNETQELNKRAKLAGSYEELQNNIEAAVAQKLKGYNNYWDGYVISTMPDKVVVYDYNTRKYLEIPYTNTDGTITVGDSVVEVKEVTTYIPVETQKFIEGELKKRAQSELVENIKTEQKEVNKSMNEEELKKAAEGAGLDFNKLKVFFNALNLGKAADGGNENNNEPSKGSQDEGNNEPEKDKETEKAFLDELKKSVDGLIEESNKLEKVNVAISKERLSHLQHAKNHIDAAVNGTEYGADDHLKIDSKSGQGNTGEEAPAVKAALGELQKGIDGVNENLAKAFNDNLEKSINKIEALFKGVASTESLTKAVENITKVNDRLEVMEKMVKEIHETPQPSSLILNGGSPLMKNMGTSEDEALENLMKSTNDPILRERIGNELATREMKKIGGR